MNRYLRWLSPLLLLALWQLLSWAGALGATPSPVAVAKALWQLAIHGEPFLGGTLWGHILVSLYRILAGFILATIIGVGLGLLMGWYPKVYLFWRPTIEILRPIPPFAWVVLAILWFKVGNAPAIFITFLAAFFPILLNTVAGIESLDPVLREAAETLGATRRISLFKVALPWATPSIFTGLRVGLGVAWMSLIAAEMVGVGTLGLGLLIETSKAVWRLDYVVAAMVVIGLIGLALDYAMRRAERYLLRWR